MKRLSNYALVVMLIAFSFSSCLPLEDMYYDETFLIGKWEREYYDSGLEQTVSEFYRYYSDYTGATWVPAEDISESEAQEFTWTLVNSDLTHIHIMESGGSGVPKIYKVTKLTASTLTYKDDFGNSFTFSKVED
jgi:hypothetical protein